MFSRCVFYLGQLLCQLRSAKLQPLATVIRGQGRVCTTAKLAYVQPAARQSFHSLCAAYRPCSGLRPETPKESDITVSNSEQRKRTGRLPPIRCFEKEEGLVRQKAADCSVSVGQFMLAAALGRQTRSKMDEHILNELRRLGGLQKHLFNEGGGVLSKEYAAVLVELRAAIARIGN